MKNKKSEKYVLVCKIRCLVRVAKLEKMRELPGKIIKCSIEFSSKIDLKSSKKSRKTDFAAKIDKKALPGTAFWGKSRILVIFGLPGGTQKLLKIYEGIGKRGLGSHLVATLGDSAHFFRFWLHFWCILAPFWVPRGHFLTNLYRFSTMIFMSSFHLCFLCFTARQQENDTSRQQYSRTA